MHQRGKLLEKRRHDWHSKITHSANLSIIPLSLMPEEMTTASTPFPLRLMVKQEREHLHLPKPVEKKQKTTTTSGLFPAPILCLSGKRCCCCCFVYFCQLGFVFKCSLSYSTISMLHSFVLCFLDS